MKSVFQRILFLSFTFVFVLGSASSVLAAKVKEGKEVTIDYVLTVEGEVIDSTEGKEPLAFTHGSSDIIPGLEDALKGMKPGDKKSVTLQPVDAYGEVNQDAITEMPLDRFPEDFEAQVGMILQFNDAAGKTLPAIITDVKDGNIVVSFNHPLAGKVLNFDVTVVSVD